MMKNGDVVACNEFIERAHNLFNFNVHINQTMALLKCRF
jgi:hypothetical protein